MELQELRERFNRPDPAFSAVPLWFWFGRPDKREIGRQIDEMTDKGVYGAFLHARPYFVTPYLEDEWWDLIGHAISYGREKGFRSWLYDEYAWPSGTAGSIFPHGEQRASRVLSESRRHMAKGLACKRWTAKGPGRAELPADASSGLYAAFRMRLNGKGEIVEDSLEPVRTDEAGRIEVPAGEWSLMAFTLYHLPTNVDYMSEAAIRRFLEYTHEAYKARYGEHFGGLVPGVFFDEIFMAAAPIPWTEALEDEFRVRAGYAFKDVLPYLILDGDRGRAEPARADYFETITELYERAFFRQISRWCEDNGLMLTGHTEEHLALHPARQGNYFRTMRHLHIPGADCHDYRYRYPRRITHVESKLAVSVGRNYSRTRIMSEAMGGAGWACTLQEFKRGVNVLAAMGVNFFTLHGMYMSTDEQGSQADWPASFFFQNPYWKYFRLFGDYISRLSYMGSLGAPVCRIGLFYPIRTLHRQFRNGAATPAGEMLSREFHAVLDELLEHQMDVDLIDETSVVRATVEAGELVSGVERFKAVVLPETAVLSREAESQLQAFEAAGGRIVFYGEGNEGGAADRFVRPIRAGSDPAKLREAIRASVPLDVEVLEGGTEGLYSYRREHEGRSVFFLANAQSRRRAWRIAFRSRGKPLALDPETGASLPGWPAEELDGERMAVSVALEPDQAVFLVFDEQAVPDGNEERKSETVADCPLPLPILLDTWKVLPAPAELDHEWRSDAVSAELDIPVARLAWGDAGKPQEIRIRNRPDEPGRFGRHASLWRGSWITRRPSWYDDSDAKELYFRKSFSLAERPTHARVCAAAVGRFDLYVNGVYAGSGDRWDRPDTLDIAAYLRAGRNVLAVKVTNDTPASGKNMLEVTRFDPAWLTSLLLEAHIWGMGESLIVATDASWIVSDAAGSDWAAPEACPERTARRADPAQIANPWEEKRTGWLLAWERGRPPLLPWGDLPLFGRTISYPQDAVYYIELPAGAAEIHKPDVRGEFELEIGGVLYRSGDWDNGSVRLEPSASPSEARLFVKVRSPDDGLAGPLRVTVRETAQASLLPWSDWGMKWHSGRWIYRTNVQLPELRKGVAYRLDLGSVRFYAEVWVNGRCAGTRIWEPYTVDITDSLRPGDNEIVVVVANTAANRMRHDLLDEGRALGWNRYWYEENIERDRQNLVSGLLGPVRILCAGQASAMR